MVKKMLQIVIITLAAIGIGSVNIPIDKVVRLLLNPDESINGAIVLNIRLPRVLIGILVGASLSAIFIMLILPFFTNLVPISAFLGAMVATFVIFILAWKQDIKPVLTKKHKDIRRALLISLCFLNKID